MKKQLLGIIDWGIGGISIYRLIKEKLGNIPVVYLSDTGATPYGKMSRRELVSRLNAVISFLKTQGVTHLIIGCNAASTAIDELNKDGITIEGVIDSAVEFSTMKNPQQLAVIGGRRTILSGIYRKKFAQNKIKIKQRIAQPLSALIESGDISSNNLRKEVKTIISPIKNCSHLLLACTHYPAIREVIKDFVSPKTELIDPAGELINKAEKWKLPEGEGDVFYTTGDSESMQKAANNAFNVMIEKVKTLTI